jgi:hypothetical protein
MALTREKEPQFSQPTRQILAMLLALGLVGVGAFLIFPEVRPIILGKPVLNATIALVFVVGVWSCFWQMFTLSRSVNWIEGFALDRPGHELTRPPQLMLTLSNLLSDRGARKSLTATSTRSILDSVGTRLDEARDITRYTVSLLIFLGLLGTFYGLATTVPAVVDTIRQLAPQEGQEAMEVFDNLMTGLEDQLDGMGTAFSSSLLGLAGSLVVGLLELFAGHGQNRFYRELEEWLSSITRISIVSGDADAGGGAGSPMVARMLEQTALQIDGLKDVLVASEQKRQETEGRLGKLADAIQSFSNQMKVQPLAAASGGKFTGDASVFERIAQGQERLAQALEGVEDSGGAGGGIDGETRMRLKNIDVQLLRILEEMAAGRQDSVTEIRADLAALTEAIRAATRG